MSNTLQSSSPKSAKSTTSRKWTCRQSPLDGAIHAAERAVLRTERRKARSLARIDRYRARIAATVANASQFDSLIEQLTKNVSALKLMAANIK